MKKLPTSVLIILKTDLLAMLLFSLFRIIQFFIHFKSVIKDSDFSIMEVINTFFYGFRFDLIIAGYLLILPFLLLLINDFIHRKLLKRIIFEFTFIAFSLAFLIAIADIPYYNKFYNRLTIESFAWFRDFSTVVGMVFQDIKLWSYFIPLFFILWLFRKVLYKIFFKANANDNINHKKIYYLYFVLFLFISLRGGFTKVPLRYRDAFNGKNVFLNSLKLNPVFTVEKSYEEEVKNKNHKYNLIDEQTAIKNVQNYFSISNKQSKSPISRKVTFPFKKDTLKKNVVLVLMEGMGASKMKYFGSKENRTPFLDSLFLEGISFTNLYSNGIHTYAGVFGTNYSYPMIFGKHPMTQVHPKKYNGLPYTLSKNAYQTSFFIAGDGSFDNMANFLLNNHYQKVYTDADYPKKEIMNIYGVSDDYLFNFALKTINNRKDRSKPFLATILTISDHAPFRLPSYYKSNTKDEYIRATQFADWSIKQFMHKASKTDWYENTIFVFISDHGQTQGITYKTPLTYNHTPLIYYYKGVKHQIVDKMASQLDVYPTLMHLLGINYINNSFGIDLLSKNRAYTIFNHDNEYGIIDKKFLLIVDKNKTLGLYKYQNKDKTNYMDKYPEITHKMETYFKSHIQTYQYMLENDLQFVE